MTKLIILFLALLLCLPGVSYAASIGGAKTQGQGKLGISAEWSYIFNRDLKFQSATDRDSDYTVKNYEIDKGYNAIGKVSYGIFDAMDIYVKLGVADYDVKGDMLESGSKYAADKYATDSDFLYGGGVKFSYEIENNWIIGADLQYLTSKHKADAESVLIEGGVYSARYTSTRISEWHIAPFIAKKIGNFTPYLGGKYSDLRMKLKSPSGVKPEAGWWDNVKYKADDNFGIFIGSDIVVNDIFVVNIEGRFIDETAMSLGVSYRF